MSMRKSVRTYVRTYVHTRTLVGYTLDSLTRSVVSRYLVPVPGTDEQYVPGTYPASLLARLPHIAFALFRYGTGTSTGTGTTVLVPVV